MSSSSSLSSSELRSSFQVGDQVELKGLVGKAYLNGRVGKIVGPVDSSSGRYPVDLLMPWMAIDGPDKEKLNYHTLNVKQENLIQFIPPYKRQIVEGGLGVSTYCEFCTVAKAAQDFKECSRCKMVSYCSIVCQHMDWKKHKTNCKAFRQGRKSKNGDLPLNLDPLTEHRIRQERATKCLEQGDLAGAEREYRRIIGSGSFDSPTDNYNLANTLYNRFNDEDDELYGDQGMIEEATRQARLATEKDFPPQQKIPGEDKATFRSTFWSFLGTCLRLNCQYKEGREAFETALTFNPNDKAAIHGLLMIERIDNE